MMPITPSGTRICATRMPLGRRVLAVIVPTGSGSAAIWRRPLIMRSRLLSDSVRRSSRAGSSPAARAASTSCALAALSPARLSPRASAMACSAWFLAAPLARIMAREARRAFSPRVSMAVSMSVVGITYLAWLVSAARRAVGVEFECSVLRRGSGPAGRRHAQRQARHFFPGIGKPAGDVQALDQTVDLVGMLHRRGPGSRGHAAQGLQGQPFVGAEYAQPSHHGAGVLPRGTRLGDTRQQADFVAHRP